MLLLTRCKDPVSNKIDLICPPWCPLHRQTFMTTDPSPIEGFFSTVKSSHFCRDRLGSFHDFKKPIINILVAR